MKGYFGENMVKKEEIYNMERDILKSSSND